MMALSISFELIYTLIINRTQVISKIECYLQHDLIKEMVGGSFGQQSQESLDSSNKCKIGHSF